MVALKGQLRSYVYSPSLELQNVLVLGFVVVSSLEIYVRFSLSLQRQKQ